MYIGTRKLDFKSLGLILAFGFVLLFFVNTSRTAKVVPENDIALQNRMVDFKYFPGAEVGKITARLKSGERLEGEYRLVLRDQSADGDSIYQLEKGKTSLYGQYRRLRDMTFGATDSNRKLYRGVMTGDRGTRIACEYFIAAAGNDGVGACRGSNGARFRVVF